MQQQQIIPIAAGVVLAYFAYTTFVRDTARTLPQVPVHLEDGMPSSAKPLATIGRRDLGRYKGV